MATQPMTFPHVDSLPYGPLMTRLRGPIRRAFLLVNRWFVPALDHGLGALFSNPLSGYLFVLRTRGRRSGLMREAPLGYVIVDGALYCAAGWGERTAWLCNVEANPEVQVVLPGRTLTGTAARVTDPVEWTRAYRALIASFGLLGRATVGDITALDDATLRVEHGAIPIVRVDCTGLAAGELDPGGRFWLVPTAGIALAVAVGLVRRLARRGPTAV